MDTQLEMDTMNAVPTPRFDVGENTFAAQLITSGNKLYSPPTTRKSAKYRPPMKFPAFPFVASAASTIYPTVEIAVESMMWYPRSRVRSLCQAWKKTMNQPTA